MIFRPTCGFWVLNGSKHPNDGLFSLFFPTAIFGAIVFIHMELDTLETRDASLYVLVRLSEPTISVFESKISLVKYKVLIKKVPKPMARINTMVWLFGLYKFNKLCRAVKPQRDGKNFLIICMVSLAIPANMENHFQITCKF